MLWSERRKGLKDSYLKDEQRLTCLFQLTLYLFLGVALLWLCIQTINEVRQELSILKIQILGGKFSLCRLHKRTHFILLNELEN